MNTYLFPRRRDRPSTLIILADPLPDPPKERNAVMAKSRGDFTDVLVRQQILSPDQLEEARAVSQQTGAKLADTLVKLGYASNDQVMKAIAEYNGIQYIDLTEVTIPPAVVELVP